MMRLFCAALSMVALLCVGVFASAQDEPNPSRAPAPFLKPCTNKNPLPCADKPPVVIHSPRTEYQTVGPQPKGEVVLTIVVGTDGFSHDISVIKPLDPRLDEEAAKAVKEWKFKPGSSSGKPVPVQIAVVIQFR